MNRLLFVFLTMCAVAQAAEFPLWGDLSSGPHAVGFTSKFQYDYSRTFRPKYDTDGRPITGTRARPIQIAIWYPAEKSVATPMLYEEYAHLLVQELSFEKLTDESKREAIRIFSGQRRGFSGATEEAISTLLKTKTAAVRDAQAASGKFPLIVYAPGASGTSIENPVFCEYLASHGYVVAALPSMGAYSRNASIDLTGFYAYMEDIEYVIGFMHNFPGVDPDRLGIAGFSMGGSAATLVQMRNFDIDAVVYLDTGIIFTLVESWFRQSNYYNPADLRAPQLYLTRSDAPNINTNFLDSIPYADTYSLLFEEGYRHVDFISDGIFTGVIPGYLPDKVKNAQRLFEFLARYSLHFLDTNVKKDSSKLKTLKEDSQHWRAPGLYQIEFKPAAKAPPREWEFTNMIREGKFQKARQIYDEMKSQDPKVAIFRETTINALGYEYLFRRDTKLAIDILAMNLDAFPQSANAYDSLSEAYEIAGQKELAVQTAQKGLEVISKDTSLDDRRREAIRTLLDGRIKKLQ